VDRSRGDNVQGILGAIGPFWAAHFGQNGGWDESRGARIFFCGNPDDFSATLQRPIFTKFGRVPWMNPGRHFRKFHFKRHLPSKSEIASRSNRHLTQSRLQVMGFTAERYRLLRVVVEGPGCFRGRSTFLYDVRLRRYGASKFPNFRILAYFPHQIQCKCRVRHWCWRSVYVRNNDLGMFSVCPHTKPLKSTFRRPAYSPGVTSQNDYDFSMW